MRTTKVSGGLRLAFAAALLAVAGSLGFAHRHPTVILLIAAAFTVLYVAGKWRAWRALWAANGAAGWGKALPQTVAIQAVLASIVYLIGLGLGRLIAPQPMAAAISERDVLTLAALAGLGVLASFAIDRLEAPEDPRGETLEDGIAPPAEGRSGSGQGEGDFVVLPDPVTPETLFSAYRGSNDHARTALEHVTAHNGEKPVRAPFAANDLALRGAEERLGFVLPEGLKALYRIKDGGSARDVMVAKVPDPRPIYGDWTNAFGGYEDLYPLSRLRTVHDSVLDYASEDEEDQFPEGAKKMLVLAQYYRETVLLDYRKGGEPRVGIVDFDNGNWEGNGLWFEDFGSFFARLRTIDEEPEQGPEQAELTRRGPSPESPDQFWFYDVALHPTLVMDRGVDEALWREAEARLGVTLPGALRPYLEALNGSEPYYNVLPAFSGGADRPEGLNPFPGDRLYGAHLWVTLRELSDRLAFTPGYAPWAELWEGAGRLVVVSAAFDTALMLDYREEDEPQVLHVANLDDPATARGLGSVPEFLASLRGRVTPYERDKPMGDPRLSARAPRPETFWTPAPGAGAEDADIEAQEGRLGALPALLKDWMRVRNGGAPRFRYMPPVRPNAHGYLNPVISAEEWIDVFPDGLPPMEDWRRLTGWLKETGENLGDSLRQRGHSQYMKDEYGDPEKIILLAAGPGRLTLLDKSRGGNADDAEILQIVKTSACWEEAYRGPAFRAMALRARREDL